MHRRLVLALATLIAAGAAIATAHDMFLKPERFFVKPGDPVLVRLLNGTFSKSENSIARTRLSDVSVVSPSGRARIDTAQWNAAGDTSSFAATTGAAGTYVLGTSTRPNIIPLEAKDFNLYLETDGVPDVLAARRRAGELAKGAKERYAKHVKALIQVGETRTDEYATVLGYPAEIVPLDNPYSLKRGQTLRARLVVGGRAVPNQFTLFGGRTPSGGRIQQRSVRSDADGIVRVLLSGPGTWYVKFINMTRLSGDAEADYESKWATLTFAVR